MEFWMSGCINFNILFWPFYTISISTQGSRSMIFLLNILLKYRSDSYALDESSTWDLSPEQLIEECRLVVSDMFEFENLEVNIINFFLFQPYTNHEQEKPTEDGFSARLIAGASRKQKNDHFPFEISALYESDINPELFERNQKRSIFIFFRRKSMR